MLTFITVGGLIKGRYDEIKNLFLLKILITESKQTSTNNWII